MSPSLPARGLLGLIQLYKWTLSPLIGRDCRYLPTCSSYAADAVRQHGAWAGSWMATARICRCHPWGGHGWDPAPEQVRKNSWWRPWRYGDWRGGYRPPSPRGEGVGGEANLSPLQNGAPNTRDESEASRFSSPPAPSPRAEGEKSNP